MEIVVGMSSLAGGLVLDKSELVQGSKLNTISRHDRRDHTSSCINSREPYPALRTLVERSEGISRNADELDEWYHSNSLFRFAIAAHSNRIVWMGCLE